MTSAQIIASLPLHIDFPVSKVNKLCREGIIYGYKHKEGNFEPWIISEDSFALYLKYNPLLFSEFDELDMTYDREGELRMFVEKVKSYLHKSYKDESYTLEQLSMIFDKPINQIAAWFKISNIFCFVAKKAITIQLLQVIRFLRANPNRLEELRERQKLLLAKGDERESAVRHLLMLYAYYESNKYLI